MAQGTYSRACRRPQHCDDVPAPRAARMRALRRRPAWPAAVVSCQAVAARQGQRIAVADARAPVVPAPTIVVVGAAIAACQRQRMAVASADPLATIVTGGSASGLLGWR